MLTIDNYHSLESNRAYISSSQLKAFEECKWRWWAQFVTGEYEQEDKEAFAQGHFVEGLFFFNSIPAHIQDQVFSKAKGKEGQMLKAFSDLVPLVNRLKASQEVTDFIAGCEFQSILTATLTADDLLAEPVGNSTPVPMRVMYDMVDYKNHHIKDMKVVADIHNEIWTPNGRVSWVEAWGYHYQAAFYGMVYQAKFGVRPKHSLLACSKKTGQIALIKIIYGEDTIEQVAALTLAVATLRAQTQEVAREGACNKCDYCATTLPPLRWSMMFD